MQTKIKQLHGISQRLNELIEDMHRIMDYIDNTELYSELDNNIKSPIEAASTRLEITIDDIEDGMYEDEPMDDISQEWD